MILIIMNVSNCKLFWKKALVIHIFIPANCKFKIAISISAFFLITRNLNTVFIFFVGNLISKLEYAAYYMHELYNAAVINAPSSLTFKWKHKKYQLQKYPVKNANIPDIGHAQRIKAGNDLSLPIITPSEGESTYVVFANNFRQALKIKVCNEFWI